MAAEQAKPIVSKRDAKRWAKADGARRLWNEWMSTIDAACERDDCEGPDDCPDCARVWEARKQVIWAIERGVEDLGRPPWVERLGDDAAPQWRRGEAE